MTNDVNAEKGYFKIFTNPSSMEEFMRSKSMPEDFIQLQIQSMQRTRIVARVAVSVVALFICILFLRYIARLRSSRFH